MEVAVAALPCILERNTADCAVGNRIDRSQKIKMLQSTNKMLSVGNRKAQLLDERGP